MQSCSSRAFTTGIALGALSLVPSLAFAQAPTLGAARNFAVLGGSTVTNTGPSVITGDLGVSPGTALTGFPPGLVTGAIHAGDALALQAQSDLTLAYDALAGAACDVVLTGMDLGGLTLSPGVYCFSASAPLNGVLTLDAQGDSGATFVFQIGSTLLATLGSSVLLVNGAQPDNVFWQLGSSATLAAGVAFTGNLIALTSITLSRGTSHSGRALARTGAVTMDTSSVTLPLGNGCGTPASVVDLMRGCGIPGAPLLTCSLPVLGQLSTVRLDGTVPAAPGLLRISLYALPVASPGDCQVFLNRTSFVATRFITNGNGDVAFSQLVGTSPFLCGSRWVVQGLVLAPSGGRPFSASNALLLTLGN